MLENYVVIDLEMTGLKVRTDYILEMAAVRVREGSITETYTALLRWPQKLTPEITELTGITEEMLAGGKDPEEAMAEFFGFIGEDILAGQNVIFDYSFLKQWAVNRKKTFEREAVDTLKLARKFLPNDQKKDLESLCGYFGIERNHAHRALEDALATQKILEQLKMQFGEKEPDAFVPKPLVYKVKRQTPATKGQKEYLRRYAAHYGIALPEDFMDLTRSQASRLTNIWMSQYGKLPSKK